MSSKQPLLCKQDDSWKIVFFLEVFFLNFPPKLSESFMDFWQEVIGRVAETVFHASRGTYWGPALFWEKPRFSSIFLSRTSANFFSDSKRRSFWLRQKSWIVETVFYAFKWIFSVKSVILEEFRNFRLSQSFIEQF